ncbi:MAG TPA: glycosyltransferase family A protein [Bdellovibrionales bacterium]|nr:glycosyltransferase family A protein [Bdellovibrionales bacterium]
MPVKNAAPFLKAALAGVFAQTFADWRLIAVVDPLSDDGSEAILRGVRDPRVRAVRGQTPGAGHSRNLALSLAGNDSRWTAFLDADDVWLPEKLARQMDFMYSGGFAMSATAFRRIDENGQGGGRLLKPPEKVDFKRLLKQNCLCCSSVMLDRRRIPEPSFREIGCEDFDLWLRLLRQGFICGGLREDLVRYRVVGNSRGSSRWRTVKESWDILKNELGRWPAVARMPEFLARAALKHARW